MTLKTLTLAFASSALLLAACDSGDGDSDGSSTTNTTPPATQTDPMTTGPTSGDDSTSTPGDTTATPDDTTGTPDDTTDAMTDDATTAEPALSFAADVYPAIIMPSCSCHNSAAGSGGLAMGTDATAAYAALIGVPSSTGKNYVTAGDVGASYIHDKVTNTQSSGNAMPLGTMGLAGEQVGIIDTWIAGGALP
jgi:hypothetical protein